MALTRLPRLAFSEVKLPVKFAVLPVNAELTVKLLLITFPVMLAKLASTRLPKLAFNEVILPIKLAVLPLN